MSTTPYPVAGAPTQTPERRLRLWPGILLVAALWIFFTILWLPQVELDNRLRLQLLRWGPTVLIGGFFVWWLFLSRAPWFDRFETLLVCLLSAVAIVPFIHKSVEPQYFVFVYPVYALPVVLAAWVGWLVLTPFLRWPGRHF